MWGCSSAGRAPALQAGGQEFDSPHLHHRKFAHAKLQGISKKEYGLSKEEKATLFHQYLFTIHSYLLPDLNAP